MAVLLRWHRLCFCPPSIQPRHRPSQNALRLLGEVVCNAVMFNLHEPSLVLTLFHGRLAADIVAFVAMPFSFQLRPAFTAHVRSYQLCCRGARRGPSVFLHSPGAQSPGGNEFPVAMGVPKFQLAARQTLPAK